VSLNLLTLVAVPLVAVFGALQRLSGAAVMLVSLVLAGGLASVLGGPVADLFGDTAAAEGTWAFVGEACCFWVILCVALFLLRAAGERLLRHRLPLPAAVRMLGGAVLGALAGYLAAGICLMLIQMLPVAPAILGYEPFRYVEGTGRENPERVERGETLVLAPDRSAIWVLDTVSGGALLGRYGDVYPPAVSRTAASVRRPKVAAHDRADADVRRPPSGDETDADADDFLYYCWYRRWQAVRWRTDRALGPVAEIPPGSEWRHGLALRRVRGTTLYGMDLKVLFAVRSEEAGFPGIEAPAGKEFLRVRLRFEPVGRRPRTIDSAQFYLVDSSGEPVAGHPLLVGEARKNGEDGQGVVVSESAASPPTAARNLRFAFSGVSPPEQGLAPPPARGPDDRGVYACTGVRFRFREPGQYAARTLVFAVPASRPTDDLRLFMAPCAPRLDEVNQ